MTCVDHLFDGGHHVAAILIYKGDSLCLECWDQRLGWEQKADRGQPPPRRPVGPR